MNSNTLDLLKAAFWNCPVPSDAITEEVFQELSDQAMQMLVYDVIDRCSMEESLRTKWKGLYKKFASVFLLYMEEQVFFVNVLRENGFTPVILKGLSAAMYYPEPMYRALGDIDAFPFPGGEEHFDRLKVLLKEKGYSLSEDINPRHLAYHKRGLRYEIHRYFSEKATDGEIELDKIIECSTPVERRFEGFPDHHFYSFPDEVNGLIFLQHIHMHISSGLGLRQIVDWMFFVESVVTDAFWQQKLKPLTDRTGLTTLAVTVTKMCEIFLGEPEHSWTSDADENACEELFILLDEYGNFGRKMNQRDSAVSSILNQRIGGLKGLQQRGLSHWPAAQKHKLLRPFAWLYQICRYVKKGLFERDPNSEGLFKNFKRHRRQKKLFEKLEVGRYRK